MNELQKLIEKWDEQIALHRRACEDPLMYTKEDRLKNSHYAQAICAVVADLKKLTIPAVVGRSEQLVCPDCKLPFTKEELQIKEHCFNCGWEFAN
jgi:hypothetical protein